MPTKYVTAHTTAQALFTTPGDKKAIVTRIIISDAGGTGALVMLLDVFTPDASNTTTSPSAQTETRLEVDCNANDYIDIDLSEDDDGLEIFGECQIDSDQIDADLHITVFWKYL